MIGLSVCGRQGQMSHNLHFVLWKSRRTRLAGEGGFSDHNFVLGDCNCLGAAGSVRQDEASGAGAARAVRRVRLRPHAVRSDGAQCCVLHIRWRSARGEARRAIARIIGTGTRRLGWSGLDSRRRSQVLGSKRDSVMNREKRLATSMLLTDSWGILRWLSAANRSAHSFRMTGILKAVARSGCLLVF
jgi:hypothetical protein